MLKVLFLVLLSTYAFALDSGSEWWIYSYEDVGTLKAVFNYLAMVSDNNAYMETIRFAIYVGMTLTVFIKFFDITAIPKYFVVSVATIMLIFGTTATVHIVNVKSYDSFNPKIDNYAVVDDVPYIFAIVSSCFSNIGYNSALLIETIFSSITDNVEVMETSFLKTGHLGIFKILTKLDSIDAFAVNTNGKKFKLVLDNYMQSCIYDVAFSIDRNIRNEIVQQSNMMGYLSPLSSTNDAIKNTANIIVLKYDNTQTTCFSLYSELNTLNIAIKNDSAIYDAAKTLTSRDTSNFDNAASAVTNMMNQSNLTSSQAKITNYIMNNSLLSAVESSWQNYGVGSSNGINSSSQAGFGAGLAIGQLQLQGKVKAKSASMVLPAMHSILQAVMYVLFPVILIVQLFSGGIKLLQNYILGLLWLELWVPSYSVLNYFTTKEAETGAINILMTSTDGTTSAEGLLNLANMNEIYNTIANEAALAADMYWMIPAIAGFMLFASFHALAGITSGVAGLVGQYSSTQTLESQRNEFAALNEVNKELNKQNPLYTGNIGELKQMQGQMQFQSAASITAGKLLGTETFSVGELNKLVKPEMFQSMKSISTNMGELNSTTRNGPLTSAIDTYKAKGFGEGSNANGLLTASQLDSNLFDNMETTTTFNNLDATIKGKSSFESFSNIGDGLLGNLENVHKVEENINANSKLVSANNIGDNDTFVGLMTGVNDSNKKLGESIAINNLTDKEMLDASTFSYLNSTISNSANFDYFGGVDGTKDVVGTNTKYDAGVKVSSASVYGEGAFEFGKNIGTGQANINIGTGNEYAQQGDNVRIAAELDKENSISNTLALQKSANLAFNAGIGDGTITGLNMAKSQYVSVVDKDGSTVNISGNSNNNVVGEEIKRITDKGVLNYAVTGSGHVVNSELNNSETIKRDKIYTADTVNSNKYLEDYSYFTNYAIQTDYSVLNKGAAFKTNNEYLRTEASLHDNYYEYLGESLSRGAKVYGDAFSEGPKAWLQSVVTSESELSSSGTSATSTFTTLPDGIKGFFTLPSIVDLGDKKDVDNKEQKDVIIPPSPERKY